jgi:HD-GYP domain-containing protein (c-di-GMP phosphodiesterase class II)
MKPDFIHELYSCDTQTMNYPQLKDRLFDVCQDMQIAHPHTVYMRSKLDELAAHHAPSAEHSIRVGLLTADIAYLMSLDPKPALFGVLHDVGKKKIPLDVLAKTSSFTASDMDVMKAHAQAGYEILSADGYHFSAELARRHHRWQPNRYPIELKPGAVDFGSNTQLMLDWYSRILSIADQFDAMGRPNARFTGGAPSPEQKRRMLLDQNPDFAYTIKQLYFHKILR